MPLNGTPFWGETKLSPNSIGKVFAFKFARKSNDINKVVVSLISIFESFISKGNLGMKY